MTKSIKLTNLVMIDKSRPELGYADGRLASLKTESKVSAPARLRPTMAERQSNQAQIAALSLSIDNDLLALVGLIKRGRKDRAVIVCDLVARKKARMQSLVDQRNLILSKDAITDRPVNRPATTKTVVARKSFKRWGDK